MAQNSELKAQNVEMGIRLLEGDESVLEDILRTFGPQINKFLLQKYAGYLNEADCEDIISKALFKLWKVREDYDESKGIIRSFLFKIADNLAKDELKSWWRKARILEVDNNSYLIEPDRAELCAGKNCTDVCLSKNDKKRLEDLTRIIANLPEAQRFIIGADALARDGKADSESLGKELQIPSGTVRVYRSRALTKIKEELRKLGHILP